jgi:flagellar biosynthetic protein FliR
MSGGLAARFMVDGLMASGQLIATVMGLSYGSILDPIHGAESTALGELLSMASLGVMVALGIHREAIAWLCRSVVELPPMAPVEIGRFFAHVLAQAIEGAAFGVRLAFPIMTAVTFGHVAMGVIGRGAEQVNLSSIGFSVTILAGGGALYVMAPTIAEMAARAALAAFSGGVG